ncbi:hypothetical protein CC85DRAFT_65192 [Cutaneotrichosporon oleaginosum]|uniref:Uncharacterized protein n=1 Tax=Cutaneotrichosporon oleaginosum TaxID=879819 RepID=A0A0J0XQ19_9TREE|nr:uncharacterized protein CC85DRAFT_65192 [Cutaneotrichosporon oleaginosum]KLT43210.1 hypothetical protein CC85DRAFT_65192 [Cutaneotrichosporon oleaginosum]TXT09892.1 hypothetical protein COLE_03826 [Cutaneotrichosporon oleaginosum]
MPWLERERGRGERRGRDQEGDTIPRSCRLSSTPLSLPVGTSPYALVAHFRHKAWIPLSFCSLRVISYTTLPSSLSRRRSPLRSHRGVFRAVRPRRPALHCDDERTACRGYQSGLSVRRRHVASRCKLEETGSGRMPPWLSPLAYSRRGGRWRRRRRRRHLHRSPCQCQG